MAHVLRTIISSSTGSTTMKDSLDKSGSFPAGCNFRIQNRNQCGTCRSGRAGGGIINDYDQVRRQRIHGTVYEFYQGRIASALACYRKNSSLPTNRNTHQFGGTVGGPVFLPRFGEGGPIIWDGRNRILLVCVLRRAAQLRRLRQPATSALSVCRRPECAWAISASCSSLALPRHIQYGRRWSARLSALSFAQLDSRCGKRYSQLRADLVCRRRSTSYRRFRCRLSQQNL